MEKGKKPAPSNKSQQIPKNNKPNEKVKHNFLFFIHLKLIQCYVNYISIKQEEKKITKDDTVNLRVITNKSKNY